MEAAVTAPPVVRGWTPIEWPRCLPPTFQPSLVRAHGSPRINVGAAVDAPPAVREPGSPRAAVDAAAIAIPLVAPVPTLPPTLSKATMKSLKVRDAGSKAPAKLYATSRSLFAGEAATFVYRIAGIPAMQRVVVVLYGSENVCLRMVDPALKPSAHGVASVLLGLGCAVAAATSAVFPPMAGAACGLALAAEACSQVEFCIDRENVFCLAECVVPACAADGPYFSFRIALPWAYPASSEAHVRPSVVRSGKGFQGRAFALSVTYGLAFFAINDDVEATSTRGQLLHVAELQVLHARRDSMSLCVSDRWGMTSDPIVAQSGYGIAEDNKASKRTEKRLSRTPMLDRHGAAVLGYLTGPNEYFALHIKCPAVLYKDVRSSEAASLPLELAIHVDVLGKQLIKGIRVAMVQTVVIQCAPLEEHVSSVAQWANDFVVFEFAVPLVKPLARGQHCISVPRALVKSFTSMAQGSFDGKEKETEFLESYCGLEVKIVTQLKVLCEVRGGKSIAASVFPRLLLSSSHNHQTSEESPSSLYCVTRVVNDTYGFDVARWRK